MKKKSSSRSSLLLMELIIAILFFSLASAVCLQLFVKASLLGRDAKELDAAVRCATSAAELLSRTEEPMAQIMARFPESYIRSDDHSITLLFDADFQSCGSEDMVYQMDIITREEDAQTTAWSVILYRDHHSETIYQLDGTIYQQYIKEGA